MYGPLSGRALANVTDMFQITSNKISGGLGFFDFPSGALPLTLDFQSNSVGNGSKICLPPAWPGRLDLSGSTFKGTLTVGLATAGNAEQLDQPYDAARPCGRLHDLENWTEQRQGTYCPPAGDTETVVNFTAADIRILQWHLPLNCWFRWAGYGLSYHLWRPYPDGPESPMAHLKAWRTTLHRPEPAPLDTMSRYLAEKGNYVDSRDIQIEAKRLNYAPDCAPERPLVACLYDLLAPSALVSSHAAAAVLEDGAQPAPPDLQERAASLLTRCPSKHYTCISLACRLWRGSGVRYRVYFRRDCILLLVLHMV